MNPEQRAAVEHGDGPLLVLAGAGTGKTRVLVHRIARLVERGTAPWEILAVTFTNKAAQEMRSRLRELLGDIADRMWIGTFHATCAKLLRKHATAVGLTKSFQIFDDDDQMKLVEKLLKETGMDDQVSARTILSRIDRAKNRGVDPMTVKTGSFDDVLEKVYPLYKQQLAKENAVDFNDLLLKVLDLFPKVPELRVKFRHVLVDEFQDTNRVQYELVEKLAEATRNLTVVGDDDQSIYAWRGADVRNILDFEEHFPGATVVKLEQNYRSCKPVIAVANAVIGKRVDVRYRKVLFTDKDSDVKVNVGAAPTPEAEAAYVVREIQRKIRDDGMKPKNFAILYRSNGQAKLLEESLRSEGVPYRLVGGQQFFERKEVKDILSYLKLALNRTDEISLRRVINTPPRGVGETSLERLALHAQARGWTLWEGVERVDAIDEISESARAGCKELERVVSNLRKRLLVDRAKSSEVARELVERIGMKRDIDAGSTSTEHAKRRWGNVEALITTFGRRDIRETDKGNDPVDELGGFLHALTLKFEEGEEDTGDMVTLSTLHGSKGLEFNVVYLIGCEEGFIPHQRTLDPRLSDNTMPGAGGIVQASDVEEERRLFYVGVTRARDELTISRCKHRMLRGKPVPRTPSRFLSDIPPECVVEFDIRDQPAMDPVAMAAQANALLAALDAIGK